MTYEEIVDSMATATFQILTAFNEKDKVVGYIQMISFKPKNFFNENPVDKKLTDPFKSLAKCSCHLAKEVVYCLSKGTEL